MRVTKKQIDPSFKKESGLFLISLDDIPLPKNFQAVDKSVILIPPYQLGGNHKHPRTEVFVGLGEALEICWLENGKTVCKQMNPKNKLFVFTVPAYTPHVIKNTGETNGVIIELADQKQGMTDIERVTVV